MKGSTTVQCTRYNDLSCTAGILLNALDILLENLLVCMILTALPGTADLLHVCVRSFGDFVLFPRTRYAVPYAIIFLLSVYRVLLLLSPSSQQSDSTISMALGLSSTVNLLGLPLLLAGKLGLSPAMCWDSRCIYSHQVSGPLVYVCTTSSTRLTSC